MSCFMSDLRNLFSRQEQKALRGGPPSSPLRGQKRTPSELAARYDAWYQDALARAQKNLATMSEVLRPETAGTIDHFLHRAGHEGCLKNLKRRTPLYDTVRYHNPHDGRLVVDIRPDRESPGRKLARIYDPDGYLFAKIVLKPTMLQIEGYRSPSARSLDVIEKITLYKRVPESVPAQERRAADRERTLSLKFARETKAQLWCFPGQFTSGRKPIPTPPEDRLTPIHIMKFKLPSVILGQEKQEPQAYALSQRLSAWTAFTADGKQTVQYAGDRVLVVRADVHGNVLLQASEKMMDSARPAFIPQ